MGRPSRLDRRSPRTPSRPPSPADWDRLEAKFSCRFPAAFMDFMAAMAGYDIAGLLDVGPDTPHDECTIALAWDQEMSFGRWDPDMIPFLCVGNGDLWCLSAGAGPASPVFYVCHEDWSAEEKSPSFAAWVRDIEGHLGAPEEAPDPAARLDPDLRRRLAQALLSAGEMLKATR